MVKQLHRQQIMEIKPYVPGKPVEEVERELGISDVIKLASNENPLGPAPASLKVMQELINKVATYPDGNCYYLKNSLAEKLNLTFSHLVVGNGSDEVIKLIAEAFLDEGDEIIMANPSFSEYDFAAKIMGARTVMVPTKDLTHDLEAMAAAVTENTKLVFVCNPNNPTGTMVGKKEVEAFLDKLPQGVITIFDEAYFEYVLAEDYPDTLEFVRQERDVIVLRTFSKIYGLAGLRIGYGVAKPELIGLISRVKEPFNVNLIAQGAALAALEDVDHVKNSVAMNEEGKKYLYEEFERMNLPYQPTHANFIWVQIKADCQKAFAKLMRLGVIVRTGDIFGAPDVVRVTVGTSEQNKRFIEALEKVLTEEGVFS
ncbi:histidinol-phosphate transaminase [Dethiobacter alkaliphilus]|uniref:Histidinol-phosphate aminotransferase n=1 Tax=Dethiobacter alkaliphilus AHT 1 TaxID=555088 RepID=C0GCU0_DETAL|nr:histidinol-phosphate transaminase [Dethiobacter alkaliphilus]EEG79025.1 histidinol-phosphate aminotransferase [Dethiobacter alkaliphilus AHT 1]